MLGKKLEVVSTRVTPRTKAQLLRLARLLNDMPPGTLQRELLEQGIAKLMRSRLARASRPVKVYRVNG